MAPSILDSASLGEAHPVFDLGEGLLDGVQVWGVWRQEPEACAGGFDGISDGFGLVAAKVVHDDNIAGPENAKQLLIDIGAKALAVDRTVEDTWCGELIATQGGQEGHGAPVPVGCIAPQALALWSPAAQWGHIGLDPGFVDEDETPWIDAVLPGLPAPPLAGNVGAALFKSEQRFF